MKRSNRKNFPVLHENFLIYYAHGEGIRRRLCMRKRTLTILLKLFISALLLALIMKKAGPHSIILRMRSMNAWFFLLAIALYVVLSWLVALRWRILLDGRYRIGTLFSLHMIGNFFNTILPSSMGGDAVKAYYLYRESKQAGVSFGSVFLDRYMGLLARLTLGLVSCAAAFAELKAIGMQWAIPALFLAFTAGSLVVLRLRIGGRFDAVADFYDYVRTRLARRRVMLRTFLLSLIIQSLLILMVASVARSIGQSLSFIELFVLVPIIMTLMIVPVSISGFGVREGAFVAIFNLTGIPSSVSVSLSFLWFLSMAAASLIGLVEYLRRRSVNS